MPKQNKLSVCMITNNDDEYICDSLSQLKDIADEIIIADIGSTDHTVDRARQEGAQVYLVDWHEDFSEVKNFLMEHAHGNWVLFLQANETIGEKHIAQVPSLLDNPNAEGYLMLIDHNSENCISSPIQTLRLVRNHTENRYRYRSFECIPDEFMIGVVNSKVEIVQRYDAMLSWEMNLRMTLLQRELISCLQDCYVQYMSGIVQINLQNIEKCIEHFEISRSAINAGYLYAPHLWKCLSWAYLFLEQYDHAMEILSEGIGLYPFYTDLLILRAEVFKQLKQYENAIADMEQCLKMRGYPNPSVPMPDISDSYAITLLGEIYEQVLDSTKALSWYIKGYQLDSTDIDLITKIGELLETIGSEETVNELLCIALEQQDPDILRSLLVMLQRRHAFSAILSHIEMIKEILGVEETRNLEVSCRLFIEDIKNIQTHDCDLDMILRYIVSCWMHNWWSIAENLLLRLKGCGLPEEVINLYIHIQKMLTHKDAGRISLEPETYEMAKAIHDDFLWKDQADKAKLLLPMLLDNQTGERCLQLAMPWTKTGDMNAIRSIYSNPACDEDKNEFIQKVIPELLRHEYPYEADELKELGGVPLPEELEKVLWVSCVIRKLKERVKELKISKSISQSEMDTDLPNGLADFYRLLCGLDRSAPAEGLTEAQTHEAIGDLYMKSNKKSEALSAYLSALQNNSWNLEVQRKVILLITEEPALDGLLRKFDRFSKNGWFTETHSFANFILGLKYYYNGSFPQATALFSQAMSSPKTNLICTSYVSSISLLEKCLNELPQIDHLEISLAYYEIRACINFILCYIQKSVQYCEDLIVLLAEKIRKLNMEFLSLS